ncbi:hypothetical protein RR46_01398 [Papilio xuthus]|uniref:Uncharacterized protein n=1 Tax=Papilio xuthus TaxID=66420 RepID=A0A0N1ICX5_PAPXU|nr:hypothetical protein RR46_01398 [Papilio xuthus]
MDDHLFIARHNRRCQAPPGVTGAPDNQLTRCECGVLLHRRGESAAADGRRLGRGRLRKCSRDPAIGRGEGPEGF